MVMFLSIVLVEQGCEIDEGEAEGDEDGGLRHSGGDGKDAGGEGESGGADADGTGDGARFEILYGAFDTGKN